MSDVERSRERVTVVPTSNATNRRSTGHQDRGLAWIGVASVIAAFGFLGWLLRSPAPTPAEPTNLDRAAAFATAITSVAGESPVARRAPTPISQLHIATEAPLGDMVPAFVDTITALSWHEDGVDIVRWPATEPTPSTLASLDHEDGWNRRIDAAGRWLVEIRGGSLVTVLVDQGASAAERPPALQLPDAERALSAAWHDTRPGRLAWLSCAAVDSTVVLHVTDVRDAPPAIAIPLDGFGCRDRRVALASWGDWGVLLHAAIESGTAHVLLDAHGAEIMRGRIGPEGEWFVGSGPGGSTVWTEGLGHADAASFLVSHDGHARLAVPGLAPGERLESAAISPDEALLALVPDLTANFGSAVRIVKAGDGSVVADIPQPDWWVSRMTWSTDSRFLVFERWLDVPTNWAGVPSGVELVFFDTESGAGVAIPISGYPAAIRSTSR